MYYHILSPNMVFCWYKNMMFFYVFWNIPIFMQSHQIKLLNHLYKSQSWKINPRQIDTRLWNTHSLIFICRIWWTFSYVLQKSCKRFEQRDESGMIVKRSSSTFIRWLNRKDRLRHGQKRASERILKTGCSKVPVSHIQTLLVFSGRSALIRV